MTAVAWITFTTLMSLCRGLVTVEKESGIVRLIKAAREGDEVIVLDQY
jgi:hypothetical protein